MLLARRAARAAGGARAEHDHSSLSRAFPFNWPTFNARRPPPRGPLWTASSAIRERRHRRASSLVVGTRLALAPSSGLQHAGWPLNSSHTRTQEVRAGPRLRDAVRGVIFGHFRPFAGDKINRMARDRSRVAITQFGPVERSKNKQQPPPSVRDVTICPAKSLCPCQVGSKLAARRHWPQLADTTNSPAKLVFTNTAHWRAPRCVL